MQWTPETVTATAFVVGAIGLMYKIIFAWLSEHNQKARGKPATAPEKARDNGKTLVTADDLKNHKASCDAVHVERYRNIEKQFVVGDKRMEAIEKKVDRNAENQHKNHADTCTLLGSIGAKMP